MRLTDTYFHQLKITNKEAVASLDKQLQAFREAIQSNSKKVNSEHNVTTDDRKSPVNVEEAAETLSRLWLGYIFNWQYWKTDGKS